MDDLAAVRARLETFARYNEEIGPDVAALLDFVDAQAARLELARRIIEAHRTLPGHQPTVVCDAIDALDAAPAEGA